MMRTFKIFTLAVFIAAAFTMGCRTAEAREYAGDPVAKFLQDKGGDAWDKVKEAHKKDWDAQNLDSLKALADEEQYSPEAMLVVLMMASNGDKAAEAYILNMAENAGNIAGAMAEMACLFLDPQKSIPALIGRMTSTGGDSDYFRGVAATTLWNLTGVYLGPDHDKWAKWWADNKDKFKTDGKADLETYRYEIRNGVLTSDLVFKTPGQDDRFIELLIEYNKTAKKFSGARWPLNEALAAMGKGDFAAARDIAEKALKDYPSDMYALYIAGCTALQLSDLKIAQARFEALAALNGEARSAKFLADYCKELIAANSEPGEIPILMRLFRALPQDATRRGWYVPDYYIYTRAFAPTPDDAAAFEKNQADITAFARKNTAKPELLAGALMMIKDEKTRLALCEEGLTLNPNRELLRLLHLQFLLQSGAKSDSPQVEKDLNALSKLAPDNALPDCIALFIGMKDTQVSESGATPLTDDELQALKALADKKRVSALTDKKIAALAAACKEVGGPAWRSRAFSIMAESATSAPLSYLDIFAIKAAANIFDDIKAGKTDDAKEIYAAVESLANKVAAEDRSLFSAYIAQSMMRFADSGMASGLRAAGDDKAAAEYDEKIKQRERQTGISAVQADPYQPLRKLPIPKIADALSKAMMDDERGFYQKYPDPATENKDEG